MQDRDGGRDGSDSARHGSDRARALLRSGGDVADELAAHEMHARVEYERAALDPRRLDQPGNARRRG